MSTKLLKGRKDRTYERALLSLCMPKFRNFNLTESLPWLNTSNGNNRPKWKISKFVKHRCLYMHMYMYELPLNYERKMKV